MRRSIAALALAVVLPTGAVLAPAARADVVVKPGETLSEIAERNGVSLQRLMQANGIRNPDVVAAGTRLVLPGAAGRNQGGASSRGSANGSVTVRDGETLSEIADRNGTTVERLMQLNGIRNPDMVAAGTRLVLPSRPRPAVASTIKVNPKAQKHVVQSGETLSHISDAYGIPVERLVSLNKITDANLVVAGTNLTLQAPPPPPKPKPVARKPKPAAPAMASKPKPAAKPALPVASQTQTATPIASQPKPATPVAAAKPAAATPIAATPVKATTPVAVAPVAAAPVAAKPAMVPVKASTTVTPTAASPRVTTTTTIAKAIPSSTTASTASPTAAATTATTSSAKGTTIQVARTPSSGPDWRSYGPMQVDWASWRPMGGSFVAPSLGSDGKPHYLAINCGARKLNATSQSGQWRTWDTPQNEEEQRLVSDLCSSKGG